MTALLVLLAAASAAASPTPPVETRTQQQWASITMFHGLPAPHVRAITQDRDGVLWFGTDAGLVRYDGRRLDRTPLGTTPAVPVRALAADERGAVWVGTDVGAFVRRTGAFEAVAAIGPEPITAIFADYQPTVLLASASGTLHTVSTEPSNPAVAPLAPLGPDAVPLFRSAGGDAVALTALARNRLAVLVGTRGRGLLMLDGSRAEELPDPQRPFFVTSLVQRGQNLFYVGAETNANGRGLFTLVGKALEPLGGLRTGTVTSLAVDMLGDVWVGTRERGVYRVRDGESVETLTMASTAGGLHSDRVLAVFADRDGVVWIGTDRGVCRYDPRGVRVHRLGATPRGNFVRELLVARDGRLWAGTQKGLYVREAGGRAWTAIAALESQAVHTLAELEDGRVLAGTPSGSYAGDAAGRQWLPLPATGGDAAGRSVRAARLFEGSVHLGVFGGGVERVTDEGRVPVWPPPGGDAAQAEVVSLSVADGALWIGTARAGTFVLRDGRVSADPGLSALGTLWVAAEARNGLWVGTDRGLYHRTPGGWEPALRGRDVRAIVSDGESGVWCATTDAGLIKVAAIPGLGFLTARLGTDYGLPSDAVYALARRPEEHGHATLVIGTNRGLAELERGRTAPAVRIVRVLGQRPYAPDEWDRIHLEYPQNSLLVEAAAAGGRTYPEHFQYEFSLTDAEGRVSRITLSRDGQLSVESLSPGGHCLHARAVGVDLNLSESASVCFAVESAPLPTASLALAALLAASLLALLFGYHQNRRLREANRALSDTRLQLVQETENERRRISRDLHDQTLADLRRLLLVTPSSREAVEAISTEVRRICEDLSPSVLQNVGLTAALEWALEESVRHLPPERVCGTVFACAEDVEARLALDGAVTIQVYRIVQEALSNAVRHAMARSLRLAVTLPPEGVLEIVVEDDGRGFDAVGTTRGRGLANVRSRASLIGAQVSWHRREGGGTTFVLRKPGAASA